MLEHASQHVITKLYMGLPEVIQNEINQLLSLDMDKRADILINSPNVRLLLNALPDQELYFIIKNSWGGNSEILLHYMPVKKILSFIDIECWDKDRLSIDDLFSWLSTLMDASIDAFIKTLAELDQELIILMFKEFIEVVQMSPTDENAPDLIDAGFETLDNLYYFRFIKDSEENQIIKHFLHLVLAHNQGLYYSLMEGIEWEFKSAMEENAYQRREIRLIELGFPPSSESLGIYQYTKPDRIKLELDTLKTPILSEDYYLPTMYTEHISRGSELIASALNEADDHTKERVSTEMVYLANKIIMADFMPLKDPENIKLAVKKAKHLASLGLAFLSKRHGLPVVSILNKINAENLFRLGNSLIIEQQRRAKRLLREAGIDIIPPREKALMEGLLKNPPYEKSPLVSTIEELELVSKSLDRLSAMLAIVRRLKWERHQDRLYMTNIQSIHSLDMGNIIITASAVNLAEKKTYFRPITKDEMVSFINTTTSINPDGYRRAKKRLLKDFNALLKDLDPEIEDAVVQDISFYLQERLVEETARILRPEDIDPRFITCMIVEL